MATTDLLWRRTKSNDHDKHLTGLTKATVLKVYASTLRDFMFLSNGFPRLHYRSFKRNVQRPLRITCKMFYSVPGDGKLLIKKKKDLFLLNVLAKGGTEISCTHHKHRGTQRQF